jgi:hypothetical protein
VDRGAAEGLEEATEGKAMSGDKPRSRGISINEPTTRAASLRRLAAAWLAELRMMGPRPRMRVHRETKLQFLARTQPWHERRAAIASALATAEALEQRAQQRAAAKVLDAAATPLDAKAVALKRAGLTFQAVAAALKIPRGTAKTWVRRARLGPQIHRETTTTAPYSEFSPRHGGG